MAGPFVFGYAFFIGEPVVQTLVIQCPWQLVKGRWWKRGSCIVLEDKERKDMIRYRSLRSKVCLMLLLGIAVSGGYRLQI